VVRTEGARPRRRVREARMIAMVILGPFEFHGAIDAWTEYLSMERLPDGSLRSRELLGYGHDWWLGEVVWPAGHNPDENEGGQHDPPLTHWGNSRCACPHAHCVRTDISSRLCACIRAAPLRCPAHP